jgi:hypothetical protein
MRDEVILPDRTLRLLERNVHGFMRQRDGLLRLGLSVKNDEMLFAGGSLNLKLLGGAAQ